MQKHHGLGKEKSYKFHKNYIHSLMSRKDATRYVASLTAGHPRVEREATQEETG